METAELIVDVGSETHAAAVEACASGRTVVAPISGSEPWTVTSVECSGARAVIKLYR